MKEVTGNIWYYKSDYICLTTNGSHNRQGLAVMGRGVALQAKQRVPGIDKKLGLILYELGNHVCFIDNKYLAYPVKYHWYEKADINLILRSANELAMIAGLHKESTFVLAAPGTSNGHLSYEEVRKVIIKALPNNVHLISNDPNVIKYMEI